jgi:hypothetical protein
VVVTPNTKTRIFLPDAPRLLPAAALFLALLLSLPIVFISWEQFGAPILVLLVFGGAALLFIRLDSAVEERPFTLQLFLSALGIHGLAATGYNLVLHGPLLSDAISYDRIAAVLSGAGGQNIPIDQALGPLAWMTNEIFPNLVAGIFRLVGQSPNAIVAFNIVLGGSSVYLVYRIASLILGPVTARFAGWLAVLYSGFWIFSLMMLKDALGVFLVLFFFYCLYQIWHLLFLPERWSQRMGPGLAWLLFLAGAWWTAGELREYVKPVMLVAAGSLFLVWIMQIRGRWMALAVVVLAFAAVGLLWPRIAAFHLVPVKVDAGSTLSQYVDVPPTDTVGTLAEWAAANPISFGKYILFATGSTAIAPYAWILPIGRADSPAFSAYSVSIPGMWLWYFCLPFSIPGFFSAWKRSKGEILPLILFTACLFIIFSLLIPRETRHRDMLMPFLLMLSAEGLVFCRSRWPLGLFFWIPLSLFMAWKINVLPVFASAVVVMTTLLVVWFFLRVWKKGRIPSPGG